MGRLIEKRRSFRASQQLSEHKHWVKAIKNAEREKDKHYANTYMISHTS